MTSNEQQIVELVDAFVAGWNARDGAACAAPFAPDADFIAVNGLFAKGRYVIGRGHAEILSTIYKGTRMEQTVNAIRFLRPDVAVADVTFRMRHQGDKPGLPTQTFCGVVATRDDGKGSIGVFRNMVPFARPVAGALDQELLNARGLQHA